MKTDILYNTSTNLSVDRSKIMNWEFLIFFFWSYYVGPTFKLYDILYNSRHGGISEYRFVTLK